MRLRLKAMLTTGLIAGAMLLVVTPLWSQTPADGKTPTGIEIVERMMERNTERQAQLRHYASDRTYQLEYSGTGGEHHAHMVVHAEYTAPGHKHLTIVAESGSKVLCREVLRKLVQSEEETASKRDWQRAMFSPESYQLKLIGREEIEGVDAWMVQVEPKELNKVSYRGTIWVSTDDYATVRVLAEPGRSPSWMLSNASFDAHYMRRNGVWVPETNISKTHVWIGGEATVTIDYGLYSVLAVGPPESAGRQAETVTPAKGLAHSLR